MRFKLFGYFLIFLSCVYIGFSITKHYRYKIACSQAYLNLLTSILEKIEVLHLPLSKIYESCNDTQLEKVGFLKTLKEDGLKKAYDEYEYKLLFDKSHSDFCEKLGTMPHVDTVKTCNLELIRLQKMFETQKEQYEKKIKLFPALSILAGLAIIILML